MLTTKIHTKVILLTILVLSLGESRAGRKVHIGQAYELAGGSNDANGSVGVAVVISNISEVKQTVSLSGGIIANRPHPTKPKAGQCYFEPPSVDLGTKRISGRVSGSTGAGDPKVEISPGGIGYFFCFEPTNPGGEGVMRGSIQVDEDRGAVQASASILVSDNGVATWGGSGAGPFGINGGRPF